MDSKSLFPDIKNLHLEIIYLSLVTVFSVLFVLCNLIGIKLFIAPFYNNYALTTGIIIYPFTFVITDIVSEIWGSARAKFMIYVGFFMSLLSLGFVQLVLYLPPHSNWATSGNIYGLTDANVLQNAFNAILQVNGKIVLGSLLAYLIGQLLDIRIFASLKALTKGRHLWLRNNVSTLISQFIDSWIAGFIMLAWGLHLETALVIQIILAEYCFKVIFALCDTPIVYLGVRLIKKISRKYEYQYAA